MAIMCRYVTQIANETGAGAKTNTADITGSRHQQTGNDHTLPQTGETDAALEL